MLILINYNHSILQNKELIKNYKYDFVGKEIAKNIILQNEAVFVLYEPDEFILELERLEKPEPKPSKPRPREKGEADPFRKHCPECGSIAMECQCEGAEECKFCRTGEPYPIVCSCRTKSEKEEHEDSEEPKLYQATLKPESNLAEIAEKYLKRGCETCQSGKARLIQQNCSHCGNQTIKANCCGRIISDCSCPSSQENCGKSCKSNCKPLEQKITNTGQQTFIPQYVQYLVNQPPQVHYQTFVQPSVPHYERKTVSNNYDLSARIAKIENRSKKTRRRTN